MICSEAGPAGVAVEIRAIHKAYGELHVLRGLSLSLAPGEFMVVVGRSGCGKSTLLRQLAGLEQPDKGGILVDGLERRALNPNTKIMFQEDRLLPWKTVLDNVGLGLAGAWGPLARQALADVGLAERSGDWPAVLSGGQKQRVSLARALTHSPRFLLLDEPMGALDALTRIEMQQLIERLWLERGFTALLVTHDVAEAVILADRVVLVENGLVTHDLPVILPRPRIRGTPALVSLEVQVLEWILAA